MILPFELSLVNLILNLENVDVKNIRKFQTVSQILSFSTLKTVNNQFSDSDQLEQ